MQLAATIAVVVSVLVFAFQARELARQSRLANEVAVTRSHGEIVLHWKKVMDVFIRYPELHAYYFDQTPDRPSASDAVRLGVVASSTPIGSRCSSLRRTNSRYMSTRG